ncbi:MAG: DEAD/DEAH box helicase [Actinobacteria bacterium]|nr:DEAD/DEAH box helicase [Actinomycetota bacterium]
MNSAAQTSPADSATDQGSAVADDVEVVAAEPPADADPLAARAPVRPDSPSFADFPVRPEIVQALADVGITHTFAIQELTLPVALAGRDLIGQARTGTGKTLGFGVPLLNRLERTGEAGSAPQALVVAPTRELAVQVAGDLSAAGKRLGARVLSIYGGRAYEPQIEALRRGVDVVVGTPGRLLDLAQQGRLVLGAVRALVLDEADEMLDLGFLPDIEKLLGMLPAQRQTMLFSATMPGPIVSLARQFLNQPLQIRAEHGEDLASTEHVDQYAYRAHNLDKPELLARVLQANGRGLTMIFTRTKRTAARVAEDLVERGFAAAAVHGDLGQGAREQALRAFRSGKVDVLVATDVAARGLDVDDVTHVINYQAPEDEKTYVHRIGRTARAGKSGTAITLVDWDDVPRWKLTCDALELPFHEPPETYSTSPHLRLELNIPDTATGTLPRAERTRAGLDAEEIEKLGGRDERRPTRRTGGRDGARAGGRDGARDGGREGARDGGREAGRDGGGETGRESGRDGGRNPRSRRRTRAGQPVSGEQTARGETAGSDTDAASAESIGDAGPRRPRRRRRRAGAGAAEGPGVEPPTARESL